MSVRVRPPAPLLCGLDLLIGFIAACVVKGSFFGPLSKIGLIIQNPASKFLKWRTAARDTLLFQRARRESQEGCCFSVSEIFGPV